MHPIEPTVLLISPDAALCTAVRSALERSQPLCHVAAVTNFAAARRTVADISPDVIVLQESSLAASQDSPGLSSSPIEDVVAALAGFAPVDSRATPGASQPCGAHRRRSGRFCRRRRTVSCRYSLRRKTPAERSQTDCRAAFSLLCPLGRDGSCVGKFWRTAAPRTEQSAHWHSRQRRASSRRGPQASGRPVFRSRIEAPRNDCHSSCPHARNRAPSQPGL